MTEALTLHGCSPTPLASYLKALGVLRLLSSGVNSVTGEPADPGVRGWWEGERFHLGTTLGREGVLDFFLNDYAPSPVIAPWNGRAGFLEGEQGEASTREGAVLMREIAESECSRLRLMRSTVRLLRSKDDLVLLDTLRAESKALDRQAKKLGGNAKRDCHERKKLVDAQAKAIKADLLPSLRSTIADVHVAYLDSCFAVATGEQAASAAPLLGAGGVDGSRDFGVRFAAALKETFAFETGEPLGDAEPNLRATLFRTPVRLAAMGSIGMFNPGGVGPNATVGYVGVNPLNHWDVLLAMEGTMVFAGALTRRWESSGQARAAFPFTFEPTQAGAGGFSIDDPNRPRGEIWTPFWAKPVRYSELYAVFAEGRLTIGGATARNGLDAARSVVQMGTSRGLSSFERYSLIQPGSSLPYQATPIGRVHTPEVARPDLIVDLEAGGWLESARAAARKKTAPGSAKAALQELEDSLFALTDGNRGAEGTRSSMVSLGKLVAWLSTTPEARKNVAPPPTLSRSWLGRADDGSPEFRVAAALAGLGIPSPAPGKPSDSTDANPGDSQAPPMAAHLTPLTNGSGEGFERATFFRGRWLRKRRAWANSNRPPTVVWGHGELVTNMIAVLERRLVETPIRGLADKPFGSASFARLSDVMAFLTGDFDDARCSALLSGMVWAQPAWLSSSDPGSTTARTAVPFAYAVLKPIFSTNEVLRRLGAIPSEVSIPIPPGLAGQLRAGGRSRDGRVIDQAVHAAFSRTRSSGLPSPYDPIQSGGRVSGLHSGRIGVGIRPDRLAAAMLIPISDRGLASLLRRAYPGSIPDTAIHPSEETPNVD